MSEPALLLKPLTPATVAPRLWRGGHFVADEWTVLTDDAPLPLAGRAIVSLPRWRAEQSAIAAPGVPTGILVQPGDSLERTTDNINRVGVIALNFPKFSDGRAYSTARRLREEFGYTCEIRATGDVLLDQLPLMLRSGFDAFEIVNAPTIAALERGEMPAVFHVFQRNVAPNRDGWRSRRASSSG